MLTIKVVYVWCVVCFRNVLCVVFDDYSSNEEKYDYETSKDIKSSENMVISKEINEGILEKKLDNGDLNSTIETSVCDYQGIKIAEELEQLNEYRNTLIAFPYAASIQRKGSHYANGALVDKRWVLSSAGEFYNVRESIKFFRVRLGSVDCKRGGRLFPIISVHIHNSYVLRKPSFDLALLRLAVPVTSTSAISPIALSKVVESVVSAKFMTAYWPRIVVMGKVLPSSAKEREKFTNMRVSTQELIPQENCTVMVKDLDNSNLCLKPIVMYHSICKPDAGAPLIAKDGLWGITSGWVSPDCPLKPSPTVFTRISSGLIRSWIDAQLLT